MNGPQELYVNSGCLKFTSGLNLSTPNKSLFTIAFILKKKKKVFTIGKSLELVLLFLPI